MNFIIKSLLLKVEKYFTISQFKIKFTDFDNFTAQLGFTEGASSDVYLASALIILFCLYRGKFGFGSKYDVGVAGIMLCLFGVFIGLFLNHALVQNTYHNKLEVLVSQPLIVKVLLALVLMTGILALFLFHYMKKWLISKYGETCYYVLMITLAVVFIVCFIHLKVYPGQFTIWQVASGVIGCLLGISGIIYYRCTITVIHAQVIPVMIKKIYFVVSISRIIPFILLAAQNHDPFFLFMFVYFFDAIMSIVTILMGWSMSIVPTLVGWTKLEVSMGQIIYRPFDLSPLKEFFERIQNMCWDDNPLLLCEGDLESAEEQGRLVKPIEMRGLSQPAPLLPSPGATPGGSYQIDLVEGFEESAPGYVYNPDPDFDPGQLQFQTLEERLNSIGSQCRVRYITSTGNPVIRYYHIFNFHHDRRTDFLQFDPTNTVHPTFDTILGWMANRQWNNGNLYWGIGLGNRPNCLLKAIVKGNGRIFPRELEGAMIAPPCFFTAGYVSPYWVYNNSGVIKIKPLCPPRVPMPNPIACADSIRLQTLMSSFQPLKYANTATLPGLYNNLLSMPSMDQLMLPAFLNINGDILLNKGYLGLLLQGRGRPAGVWDIILSGNRYVPVFNNTDDIYNLPDIVELNNDRYTTGEGSKLIMVEGQIRRGVVSPDADAVTALAQDREQPPVFLQGKGISRYNPQEVTYLPFGRENNLKLIQMLAESRGVKIVHCCGLRIPQYALDGYRALIDSIGKVVALQPTLGRARLPMPLNFPNTEMVPYGVASPTGLAPGLSAQLHGISIQELTQAYGVKDISPDIIQCHFDNPAILEASTVELEPVQKINDVTFISWKKALILANTHEGLISYQGVNYVRACSCGDYQPIQSRDLWVYNSKLLFNPADHRTPEGHPVAPHRLKFICIGGVRLWFQWPWS